MIALMKMIGIKTLKKNTLNANPSSLLYKTCSPAAPDSVDNDIRSPNTNCPPSAAKPSRWSNASARHPINVCPQVMIRNRKAKNNGKASKTRIFFQFLNESFLLLLAIHATNIVNSIPTIPIKIPINNPPKNKNLCCVYVYTSLKEHYKICKTEWRY